MVNWLRILLTWIFQLAHLGLINNYGLLPYPRNFHEDHCAQNISFILLRLAIGSGQRGSFQKLSKSSKRSPY